MISKAKWRLQVDPRERELEVAWRRILSEHSRLGRRTFLKQIGFACCGFASFLMAHRLNTGSRGSEAIAGEKTMSMTEHSQVIDIPIPPLDASRPAGTETASFALG